MTTTFALCALLVGTAVAVRSTWSPCGLSMLSTITPPAERAKGHRYGATCTWFVVGATVGGLALGALAALGALLIEHAAPTTVAAACTGLAAALVALVSDTGLAGVRLPVHYRQVNERWLDAYRPWVYGAGFGFQIGTGLTTYITTAAVYLFVVLGALGGDPWVALALGGGFGLVRGLAVTLTRRVTSPQELLAFHRRFVAGLPWAERAVGAATAMVAVVLALAAGPVAVVVVATVAVLTAGARVVVRGRASAARGRAVDVAGAAPAHPTDDRGPSLPVG
jgi:MFS family permease